MASPNTLALRTRMRALVVREIPADMPAPEPTTHVAVAVEMRRRSFLLNVQRSQRIAATNRGRDIPVSGAMRRRAKAHRNQGLCLAVENGARCGETADQCGRCPSHLTVEFLRARGVLEVADLADACAWRRAEAESAA